MKLRISFKFLCLTPFKYIKGWLSDGNFLKIVWKNPELPLRMSLWAGIWAKSSDRRVTSQNSLLRWLSTTDISKLDSCSFHFKLSFSQDETFIFQNIFSSSTSETASTSKLRLNQAQYPPPSDWALSFLFLIFLKSLQLSKYKPNLHRQRELQSVNIVSRTEQN